MDFSAEKSFERFDGINHTYNNMLCGWSKNALNANTARHLNESFHFSSHALKRDVIYQQLALVLRWRRNLKFK